MQISAIAKSDFYKIDSCRVLLFNPGGSIRFSDDLPDQGIGMTVEGENLVITMLEGESLTLNPMTGYFKQPAPALR